jgi:hypothetical protein
MPAGDTRGAPEWLSVDEFGFENRPGHGAFTLPSCSALFPDFLTSIMAPKWIVDIICSEFTLTDRPFYCEKYQG